MSWVGVIVGGATVVGGALANKGAKSAANAAAGASGAAIDEQRHEFETLLSLTAPQRSIGNQALATLGSVYGYKPTSNDFASLGAKPYTAGVPTTMNSFGKAISFDPGGSIFGIHDPVSGFIGGLFGSKHGDEKRNLSAFQQAFPLQQLSNGMLMLPDGTQLSPGDLQELAGTWYGATYHPDGDQPGWQQKYSDVLSRIKAQPFNASSGANVGQTNGLTSDGVPQGFANGPVTVDQQGNVLSGPDYSAFFKSPDYNFRLKEGLNTVENSAAAEGGLYSGNALRGITDYGQGVAAGGFNDWFKNQLALAGIGTGATSQAGQGALATGANIGNLLIDQGNARASGIIGQSNALTGTMEQLATLFGSGAFGGGYKPNWYATPGRGIPYGGALA